MISFNIYYIEMVRPSRLELPTPTMSRWCSNQLSYGRTEDFYFKSGGTLIIVKWCVRVDSNYRPPPCQGGALTN